MKTLLLILTLVSFYSGFAQGDVAFIRENFPDDKIGFRDARSDLKDGDKIFEKGITGYFNLALPFYENAYAFNPDNAELNYKLGLCYLHSPIKHKCLKYFEKSYALNSSHDTYNIEYLLGRGYHLNEKWDLAIAAYEKQLGVLRNANASQDEFATIQKYLEEAKNGKELSKEKVRVWIDNLGPNVNSAAPEYAPLISTDESILILTARRENTVGGLKDEVDNLPYEDLYISYNKAGVWSPLQNMGDVVNTNGHDAGSGLSPDGKKLFVFRGTARGGGDIYMSERNEDQWSKPRSLGKTINTNAHESAVALSYDGNELYFISDRPGGIGGNDIYMARWNAQKRDWGEAQNLGTNVNSPYDEDGVFLHPDGKTLYFSSRGHNSMGGNDIFYSEKVNGVWTKAVNIGYPINTPDDDVFFVVAADGRTAYYSSIRDEGYGEKDIYRITFLGPAKEPVLNTEEQLLVGSEEKSPEIALQPEVKVRTSRMILLKGLVVDDKTSEPVSAAIDLIDNATSEVLATFMSNATLGEYLVSLPAGRNYGLNFNADGYLFSSMNFNIPDTAVFEELYKVVRLKKILIGESIVLRNVFYDYNKSTVRKESEAELDRLKDLLAENPTIKVEISGHTDNVGGDKYNQELSEARAKSVVDYLVQKGIPTSQMIFTGYGSQEPIATNDTPEGRQENRRTEFKIIE